MTSSVSGKRATPSPAEVLAALDLFTWQGSDGQWWLAVPGQTLPLPVPAAVVASAATGRRRRPAAAPKPAPAPPAPAGMLPPEQVQTFTNAMARALYASGAVPARR